MSKSKRFPRKIPHNTNVTRPQNIIFFDTETKQTITKDNRIKQDLWLYVFKHVYLDHSGKYQVVYSKDTYERDDLLDYLDTLSDVLDTIHICSHNLIFDFTVLELLDTLHEHKYELIQFYTKSLATQFRYIKNICTYTFFDTVSLFPLSLAKISETLNINKIDIDLDKAGDKETFIYCNRDVDILIEMLSNWYKFLNVNGFDGFTTTVSSTAFSLYRSSYMNIPIDLHCNDEVNTIEREAYKGGRTEVFYKGYPGQAIYYKLDVNSMYPYVMAQNKYPTKLINVYDNPSIKYTMNRIKRYSVIAQVVVYTQDNIVSTKVKNRNIYANGQFETTLTTPEMSYLLEKGAVKKVKKLITYTQNTIFKEYVNAIYKIKVNSYENNNDIFYLIAKLMQNGLYGKFGQLNTEQDILTENAEDKYLREYGYDATTDRHFTITTINHKSFIEYYGGESSFSFPAIAAHVTAYARCYLYELMLKAGKGNYYYCDTDSLIVNELGYRNLERYIDETRLGGLKVEGITDRIIIKAPKDYRFGNEVKLKGISKTAKKIGKNRYAQQKWQRFAGLFLHNEPTKYYLSHLEKRLKRTVYSGKIDANCFLSPWLLPDDLETIQSLIGHL